MPLEGTFPGSLPRCPVCRNTLDKPGQITCEQCGTEITYSRGPSLVDLTASSPILKSIEETTIKIIDSDTESPTSSSYRTASSSPLLSLDELFTKFYEARAKPKQEAS
jgi:hypothetical protein